MKNHIRPPVKVDKNKRRITNSRERPHWWRLNVPASVNGGKKKRLFFQSEKEAKDHAISLLETHASVSSDIITRLKQRGLSVSDAIEYALKHAPIISAVTVKEACQKLMASRRAANCKPRYLATLSSDLHGFVEEFGTRMIDSISKAEVEKHIGQLTGKDGETPAMPKTKGNVLTTIKTLFNFAVEQGWRGENPAQKIRKPILDETIIDVLSPDEASTLLSASRDRTFADIFPALVIQLFAGVRRSELPHIEWEHIKDNYLRLDKTKTREKRAVEMPETLMEWLLPYQHLKGRILSLEGVSFDSKDTRTVEDAYTYRLSQLEKAYGVKLSKNVLRHSAITYRIALTSDLNGTARWAGNTPEVCEKHYLGVATKSDAETFYALKPKSMDNIIRMS